MGISRGRTKLQWRMGVPVATPVTARDVMAGIAALAYGRDAIAALEEKARAMLGTAAAYGMNSGRAALFVTLEAMKQGSPRQEVVIPAFVCPSVGRAVVKAGLKPVLCDVGPHGSGLDLESLGRVLTGRTLAVVAAHLYGYPFDVTPIVERARSAGALVIEDAAQAFGAKWHGRYAGTAGDAGIFSFGMSKVLATMQGGMAATSNPTLAKRLAVSTSLLPAAGKLAQARGLAKLAIMARIVKLRHLGPLDAVWSGAIRGKHDCDDFEIGRYPNSHGAVALSLLPHFEQITCARRAIASRYNAGLAGVPGILLPPANVGVEPVFVRFPVVVKDARARNEVLALLRSAGVNASEMYGRTDYEALRGFAARESACPQAEYLCERMLNLPTHPFVREDDITATLSAFEKTFGRASKPASPVYV